MSEKISPQRLSDAAEIIRKEIKEMIPGVSDEATPGKAERLPTRIKGGVMYGGKLLATKVSELIEEIKIGKWIWTVAQFHEAKEVLNDSFQMFLIPLCESLTLSLKTKEGTTPEQVLEEGQYTYIKTNPIISAGASVIFITPPA